jgi:glycosyltransferase involved in cell wall biosynthesis
MKPTISYRARRVYTHRSGDFQYSGKRRARYEIVGFMVRHYFQALVGNSDRACTSGARVTRTHVSSWRTIYNGIDFSMLRPLRTRETVASELGLAPDGAVIIGTSADLRDWKRIELLLEACAKLPSGSYWLLIVGDGPVRGQLEALSNKLGIESRTIFTGMKKYVGDYLQMMDVFVLPSSSSESFGNSAVEAMSQGLPTIIFSDGGGLLEHIKDADTGFVVSSTGELAERLRDLSLNRDLRLRLGNAARQYVTRKYSYENLVTSYDNLYDSLLRATR